MMCKNCGCALKPEERFCPKCGTKNAPDYGANDETMPLYNAYSSQNAPFSPSMPIAPVQKHKPMTKAKKVRIIIISVLCAVLLAGAAFGIIYLSGSEHKVIKAFDKGNYSQAVEIYNSELNGKSTPILKSSLKKRMEKIKDGVKDGSHDYFDAMNELSVIAQLGDKEISDLSDEAKERINKIKISDDSYANGTASYEKSDWYSAIGSLKNVDESNENYADAREKYNSAVEYYKEEVLNKAKGYADKGNYEKAVSAINTAFEVIEYDADLDSALTGYKAKLFEATKKATLEKAAEKASSGDYAGAIEAIYSAVAAVGSDLEYQDFLDMYTQEYVEKTIEEADSLVADRNYSGAISAINDALKLLPDNEELKAKKEKLEAEKPVSLSTLTPINGEFNWNDGLPTDPFGTTYTDFCNYAIFEGEYGWKSSKVTTAEYRLYGKYKYLSGALSPHADIDEDGYGQVKIYADDRLVYTSPAIDRKTDLVTFSADISGADYVKVVVEIKRKGETYGNEKSALILMDAQLWS